MKHSTLDDDKKGIENMVVGWGEIATLIQMIRRPH